MSEPHVEPPAADVRSFLPRPGEPVEDYAARLRALHEDLSLVLDAVERGLAAAEAEPVTPIEPVELVPEPHRSPPPPGPLSAPRGSARVEVISTPATARGEGGGASSGPQEPVGGAPRGGRRAPTGEGGPAGGEPALPSPERWPSQAGPYAEPWVERPPRPARADPWVESTAADPWGLAAAEARGAAQGGAAPAERGVAAWGGAGAGEARWQEPPPWTERRPSAWPPPPPPPAEMSFEPPYGATRRRGGRPIPPLVVAAAILGWLTAIALVIALAFGL
jgi:hypothetical protein